MRVEINISTGEVLAWSHVTRICKLDSTRISLRFIGEDGKEKSFRWDFSKEYPEDRILTARVDLDGPADMYRDKPFYYWDDGELTLGDWRKEAFVS